ncbi:gephyrin-like molybdotransferase Glp [Tumidithrix elongata RA019]|uniref:Molybdopterin molybdenumtransferase n=1 Tax=Tumidithrix elongata BACA0141 TaxID=2716417 RepID=A0AAW9Q9T6_9CYAN|nr:gephyrin-like molybdotransferase Glp [Tumidithrix elongata RA019]
MHSVSNTESTILNLIQPFDAKTDREQIDLLQALGRILAEDIKSELDFPHWDNSSMDGYAFRHADLEEVEQLAIASQDIPAGSTEAPPLGKGECVRIFTGGMLPEGADTVVMQEDVEIVGVYLRLKAPSTKGEYVRHQGEFYRSGITLLSKGTKLVGTDLGALAALRCQTVPVYRQPKVAIFSTGNELVSLASQDPLKLGQIIDSNQYTLAALVTQAGGIPLLMGAVPDRQESLRSAIETAIASADLVISSGGVSVGDYDYIDRILAEMGAELHIQSVAIKPGKPLTVATFSSSLNNALTASGEKRCQLYFGVPGNPVSAMVSFWRFIRGAIAKLGGGNASSWYPQFILAQTTQDLHAQGRRETYLWGHLAWKSGRAIFDPVENYSSGNLISVIGTNALAILKVNQTYVPAGETVAIVQI